MLIPVIDGVRKVYVGNGLHNVDDDQGDRVQADPERYTEHLLVQLPIVVGRRESSQDIPPFPPARTVGPFRACRLRVFQLAFWVAVSQEGVGRAQDGAEGGYSQPADMLVCSVRRRCFYIEVERVVV